MDKKFLSLSSVLFLSIFILLFSIISQSNPFQVLNPRAAQESQPSADRSLIFAWPLVTKAGTTQGVKVDVFVRNLGDKPIPNKNVVLTSSLGLVQTTVNPTDESGRATFSVNSRERGAAKVTATIENVKVGQELTIKFE